MSDHTLNIGCRCGLIGASYTLTHPISTTSVLMDHRQLERHSENERKKEEREMKKKNHGWLSFSFVCHVCSCVNLHGHCRSVLPSLNLSIFRKENNSKSFRFFFFFLLKYDLGGFFFLGGSI
jgi:hypothetical protein